MRDAALLTRPRLRGIGRLLRLSAPRLTPLTPSKGVDLLTPDRSQAVTAASLKDASMELALLGFQTWQILLIVGLAILVIILLIIKKRQEQ